MAIVGFPPVESANESGLLAIGGDLEVASLMLAYSQGIFPWPISQEYPMAWFSPDPRGVLDFSDLKVNKRLERSLKGLDFKIEFNNHFEEVIHECAKAKRKDQDGTWINQEIIDGYIQFHKAKFAYSIEVLNSSNDLVGGLYGVLINGVVSGESMFFKETNASKFALIKLMQHLHSFGITWLDTQMVTPVVEALGGKEIPREDFIKRLNNAPIVTFETLFA